MRYEFINANIQLFVKNVNNNKMYRWQKKRKEKYIVKKMFLSKGRNELLLILIRKAKLAKHLMRNAIICTAACTAPIELSLSLLFLSPSTPSPSFPALTWGEMQHDYILRGKLLLKWFRVKRNGARTNYSWRLFNSWNSPLPTSAGTFRASVF